MAKKKIDAEAESQDIGTLLALETGGTVLAGSDTDRYFIDSGNLALNYINSGKFIRGGIPKGVTEIFGPPASSKSLIGYTLLGSIQRAGGYGILHDIERAANEQFIVSAGHVDSSELVVYNPLSIEEVESKVIASTNFIRKHRGEKAPILHVWDSISVTPCLREWNETKLPETYTKADFKRIVGGHEQPGERAKAAGKFLRKMNAFLDENNASLFIINQIRSKIGVLYGPTITTGGGGRALEFYAHCRIGTSPAKKFIDESTKMPIGVNLNFENKKSRVFRPYGTASSIPLYFENGIDPLGGLLICLLQAGRINSDKAGFYTVDEKYSGGKEVRFKASKEKNLVPLNVLLECPSLIDAENETEIKHYLAPYSSALEITNSNSVLEVNFEDDEDENSEDE